MLLDEFVGKLNTILMERRDNHQKIKLPIVAIECSSGVSYEVSLGDICQKDSSYNIGYLVDQEDGFEYLRLYLDT